jgi:P-type Mg2+ transporter
MMRTAKRQSAADAMPAVAPERLRVHARNVLAESPRASVLPLFLRHFSNPLILILIAAAIVATMVHEPTDSIIILLVLTGSALLTLVQEYRATSAAQRLRSMIVLRSRVMCEGAPLEVPAEELVPGDVVLLAAGMLVPADGVLLDGRDLFVSQAC